MSIKVYPLSNGMELPKFLTEYKKPTKKSDDTFGNMFWEEVGKLRVGDTPKEVTSENRDSVEES